MMHWNYHLSISIVVSMHINRSYNQCISCEFHNAALPWQSQVLWLIFYGGCKIKLGCRGEDIENILAELSHKP